MSVVRIDRGPGNNPWLLHADTVAEVDAHLCDVHYLDQRWTAKLADELLDLRNRLRDLEASA